MKHYDTSYNMLLVVLSYVVSVMGSFAALLSSRRMIRSIGTARLGWLAAAALCIGGGGVWSMHFIGMSAFQIDGAMYFDPLLTAASFLAAVVVAGTGIYVANSGDGGKLRLAVAGVFTGCGVAIMHYSGMLAMKTRGHNQWNVGIIVLSFGIAIAVATVALWLTINVKRLSHMLGAAAVMGMAVSGMHYTGMTALRIVEDPKVHIPGTTEPVFTAMITFLVAVIILLPVGYFLATDDSAMAAPAAKKPVGKGDPQAA
ncbi:MAG: MHYT domain-containing protein [Acidimicrobiales bacterium]